MLDRLLGLPHSLTTAAQRADWERMRRELPPLPTATEDGKTFLRPAGEILGPKANMENPELYAVFPFRLFGVGKPGLDTGRLTFERREVKMTGGWTQDAIQAALLGLGSEASQMVCHNFGSADPGSRFPAFWGPNFDWVPDQDHCNVPMIALQAMLMQTEGARIMLLPAWPKGWDVEFRLHAPGRTTVEGVVKAGKLQGLRVTPEARRKDVAVMTPR